MRKRTTPWSACLALAGALSLGACGASTGGAKGDEEGPLTGGKADSFVQPTNAGELRFGPQKKITFDDSRHYYEMTFALTGRASVAVDTQIFTPNLDTVLYLYQRAPGATEWGKYVQKNDDAEAGTMASRLALEQAEAGEYRIIVKTFKLAMRGNIAVVGSCTGSGCPAAEPNQCNPNQLTFKLPAETGYGPSCAAKLFKLLPSEVEFANADVVTFANRCQLAPIESKAVELYRDYFDGLMGWDDFVGGEPDEEVRLNVSRATLNGYQVSGEIVTVNLEWGDETGLTFVFDDDGKLVSSLSIEQSPVNTWYCAKPGESSQGEPDTDCMNAALTYLPHDPDEIGGDSGSVKVKDIADDDEVPYFVGRMADRYAKMFNLAGSEVISFTYAEAKGWDGDVGLGMRVELQAWEQPMVTYLLTDEESDITVILEETQASTSFICEAE